MGMELSTWQCQILWKLSPLLASGRAEESFYRPRFIVWELIPFVIFWADEGLNPVKVTYGVSWPYVVSINSQHQHASSPGNRDYCYAELSISSLAVALTITSTHYAYLRKDGQAEFAWVAWFNTKTVYPRMVTHPSTNWVRLTESSLTETSVLPLSRTTTCWAGQLAKIASLLNCFSASEKSNFYTWIVGMSELWLVQCTELKGIFVCIFCAIISDLILLTLSRIERWHFRSPIAPTKHRKWRCCQLPERTQMHSDQKW